MYCNIYFTFFCVFIQLHSCLHSKLTVQYSVFGAMATAGGIAGSFVNGKLADVIGRRGVRFFGHPFLYIFICVSLSSQTAFHNKKDLLLSQNFHGSYSWCCNADIVDLWDIQHCRVACYSIRKGVSYSFSSPQRCCMHVLNLWK